MPTPDNLSPFPVLAIESSWVLDREAMGSKQKFWYRENNDATQWLFKYPQVNRQTGELAGQHWAEKIAEQVAKLLDTRFALVELAVFDGEWGSATKSFTHDGRTLLHGNELLASVVTGYDAQATFRHTTHTLENIFRALDWIGPASAQKWKPLFAEYIVLDALVANTDRHHENWGLLLQRTGVGWTAMLAPSFDHASSLGRELQDIRRMEILGKPDGLATYVNKGHGGIYWMADEKKSPSPLELVRLASGKYPDLFQSALRKVTQMDASQFEHIIARIPESWMSVAARRFALALLHHNHHQLLSLST
jgi:hypothetical protein